MVFLKFVQPVADLLSGQERTALLKVAEMGEPQVRQILEHFAQNHGEDAVKAEAQAQLDALDAQ